MIAILFKPTQEFTRISTTPITVSRVLLTKAIWLGLIPPVCAWIGTTTFGWRLGIGQPVHLDALQTLAICAAYYLFLLGGFVFAILIMRWMAPTYGARTEAGRHAALIAAVSTPLMLGGLLHLYPQLGFNLMLLVPAIIWSTYLLYTGLPICLRTETERGMLMATSMLGVFFVAANALMILTMFLWTTGLGPDIGFDWRASVGG